MAQAGGTSGNVATSPTTDCPVTATPAMASTPSDGKDDQTAGYVEAFIAKITNNVSLSVNNLILKVGH